MACSLIERDNSAFTSALRSMALSEKIEFERPSMLCSFRFYRGGIKAVLAFAQLRPICETYVLS